MRLVLVGPPGSGKGTQGPALAAHLGVRYISTGDVLRAEVAAGTGLGRRVSDYEKRLDESEKRLQEFETAHAAFALESPQTTLMQWRGRRRTPLPQMLGRLSSRAAVLSWLSAAATRRGKCCVL